MSQALRQLESGELLPVYGVVGSSTILTSEAVTLLRSRVLTRAPDFNRDELRADEVSIDRILEAAQTLPMMAERRWVHVIDAHKLKSDAQERLSEYVKAPVESTVMVLSAEKIDGRRKLGQTLKKKKALFAFDPPKPWELTDWIEQRAEHRGLELDRDAAGLLGDFVGTEVGPIDRAFEKLSLYAGEPRRITAHDVQEVVAPTRVHSIFDLTDALGGRDLGRATLLLRNALEGGESGLMVLAMIARQLRQLLQYKTLVARRMPNAELARALGIKPFFMSRIAEQAKHYEADELARALDFAHQADIAMKGSKLSHGVILDQLLLQVMSPS